jgi:methyl-accepting chemotaxis protein
MYSVVIPIAETRVLNSKKEVAKSSVQVVHHLIQNFYNRYLLGELKLDEAKKLALRAVEDLRYNGNKYFWIHNQNFVMLMHPMKKELNGESLRETRDQNGKLVFNDINQMIYQEKEGFYTSQLKTQDENFLPKMSYIKSFDEWGWVIGNGVSLGEFQSQVADIKNQFYFGAFLICVFASFGLLLANVIAKIAVVYSKQTL